MRAFIIIAALAGCSAVIFGALGAHALRAELDEASISAWQTAVDYQFWHALALLVVGLLSGHWPRSRSLLCSGWLFVTGMVLFSGSLYLLAATSVRMILGFPLGLLTPVGGIILIAAWVALVVAAWVSNKEQK